MQVIYSQKSHHTDYYGLKLLATLLVLLTLLAYTSFYLIENYYSKSFLEYDSVEKKVYFLKSTTLENMYEENGMDYDAYVVRLKYFQDLASKEGYSTSYIYSDEISTLKKGDKLIALDMMSLSHKEISDIDTFVDCGGSLIYNFTSGFLDENLHYQQDNLVSKISNLHIDDKINTVRYDKKSTGYLTARLLSPLTTYLYGAKALELSIYDPLPIFNTPSNLRADAYITNWSQSNYLVIGKKKELSQKQAGLIWHGYKGEGKWVYFSFPSYSMVENSPKVYANLFKGMLNYLDSVVQIEAYPYIDARNAVFVSEDTEYKYENLEQFYNVAQKNKFPVTAFCVANLAEEHKALMQKVSKSKYIEIGSHSYTHKKIVGEKDSVIEKETEGSRILLRELSHQEVIGFRPPREELSKKMLDYLSKGGFKYILGAGENLLTPYQVDKLLFIPRHGTDDYSYLVNLDWDAASILKEMKHQVNVLASLDGIYTLSTHTHLMTYSTNINMVDNFFQYVNLHKNLTPMNGKMLYERLIMKKNISTSTALSTKKIVLTLSNSNLKEVHNMHYSIYVDSDMKLTNIESEIIGIQTKLTKVSSNEYILVIDSMKPKSQMVLFINYDKNI